jgi:hypothetical protein
MDLTANGASEMAVTTAREPGMPDFLMSKVAYVKRATD